jgi:hypothetical protein
MFTYGRALTIVLLLAVALLAGTTSAWAGGYRQHGSYHGYGYGSGYGYGHGHRRHHRHSGYRWGMSWSYPASYWGGYAYNPGWSPYYGPAYGPGGGVLNIGYGSGGHHGSWGIGLSLPLYLGPRYAPQPAVVVPAPQAMQPTQQQASGDCLQVREYQTEILVGGKTVPAYGDACLMPDGSWKKITGPFAAD